MSQDQESARELMRVLEERILGLDLTYQNTEGDAYRQGHERALAARADARALPPSARDELLQSLTETLAGKPAALYTAAWILGLPTPSPLQVAHAAEIAASRQESGAARRVSAFFTRLRQHFFPS
jgi:hypothetical protein